MCCHCRRTREKPLPSPAFLCSPEEERKNDNGSRQHEQEMDMPVEGIGHRDADKP